MSKIYPALILFLTAALQAETGAPIIEEKFESPELGQKWHINYGSWTIEDGILKTKQRKADNHAAAARFSVATGDAVYSIRFRFTEAGEAFHLGFDPAKGELQKKGHLFSIIIKPDSWSIMKHLDKNKPKDDPNEIIAEANTDFKKGTWYSLQVTTTGNSVLAEIDGKKSLQGSHATFAVKKPTVVLRTIGDGVDLDDLKVWKTKN
ncbi:MAG: hypothetical protein P1V20_09610 [Verrucomicrobiales bacterium]|nr:hypothetical protein [Verrucomicrobiales bacterium]